MLKAVGAYRIRPSKAKQQFARFFFMDKDDEVFVFVVCYKPPVCAFSKVWPKNLEYGTQEAECFLVNFYKNITL
jgi:hypothetical protein